MCASTFLTTWRAVEAMALADEVLQLDGVRQEITDQATGDRWFRAGSGTWTRVDP